MDVQAEITNQEGWKRTLKVTVPAPEIDAAFVEAEKEYRKKAKIAGFRPGKAPIKVVAQRFGDAIRQDVLETVLPRAFQGALRQLTLNPIGDPAFTKLEFERGTDMTFEAEVEVRPDIEVTGYRGLTLKKQIYKVSDTDVDRSIEQLREESASTTVVTRPAQEGDVVVCNLQKIHDRLNRLKQSKFDGVTIELRAGRTRPEFLKDIPGMSAGEGKEIEVAYSADESDPDLAGNTVLYRTWLKSVSQKNLPEANDEFATRITDGQAKTLVDLRKALLADLERRTETAVTRDLRGQMRKAIVDANPTPVPQGFLQRYLGDVFQRLQKNNPDITEEQVRSQFEPVATEQFRWDYAFFEIAKTEKVEVTNSDVEDIIKKWPTDAPEKPNRGHIQNTLLENRVFDKILESATIEEVESAPTSRIVKP